MQQQSVDVSADNEVMAILSSPVQTFVVKPQARPGGVASAAGALGPLSPKSNGQAAHAAAGLALLVGGADYLADGGAHDGVVGQGKGGDMAGGSGAAPLGAPGISPPHTPGPPKSNSASWDPQSQSASSAFSVPAGRGGGRGDGAGAGRGGSVGNSAFGALKLGSFRVVGGDLVNRGSIQEHAPLSKQGGRDAYGRPHGTGGGRTPGPAKGPRHPVDNDSMAGRTDAMGVFHEFPEQELPEIAAEGVMSRGDHLGKPLSYEDYGVDGGAIYDQGNRGATTNSTVSSTPNSSFRNSGRVGGGTGRGDMERAVSSELRESTSTNGEAAAAAAAAVAASPGMNLREQAGARAGEGSAGPPQSSGGSGLGIGSGGMPDNWGIMQYGLTLENPVVRHGPTLETSPASSQRQRSGEDKDGLSGSERAHGGGDVGGGGGAGSERGRGRGMAGVDASPSSAVVMMMDPFSLREQSPLGSGRPYEGQAEPAEDLMFGCGAGGSREGRDDFFMDGRTGSGRLQVGGQAEEMGRSLGGGRSEYNMSTVATCSGASYGFLDGRSPRYDPTNNVDRAHPLRQQQQQQLTQRQQSIPPPFHPRRAIGGSPALGPQQPRRLLPLRGNLDAGAFPPSTSSEVSDTVHRVAGSNGTLGAEGGIGSPGMFRWSFPPPGMSGGEVGDGSGGPVQSGTGRLDGLGEADGPGMMRGGDSGNSSGGEGGGRFDGRGQQWVAAGIQSPPSGYGTPRRLMYDEDGVRSGGGGGGGVTGGRGGLSGSADSHQYAMMRAQQRGYQVNLHKSEGGGRVTGTGIGPPPAGSTFSNHTAHSRAQALQYPLDSRADGEGVGGGVGTGGDYDFRPPPSFESGIEGAGGRYASGNMSVGGSFSRGEINKNVSVDLGQHPAAIGSRQDGGVSGAAPPPGFPRGYEYAEYTAGMDFEDGGGKDVGPPLVDSHGGGGGGHRAALSSQHFQQMQQQQQHHRGVPFSAPHPQPPLSHPHHPTASGTRPLIGDVRPSGSGIVDGITCPDPRTPRGVGDGGGGNWESAGQVERVGRMMPGSGADLNFPDEYPARRVESYHGRSGNSSARHGGYDANYESNHGEAAGFAGAGGGGSTGGGVGGSLPYDPTAQPYDAPGGPRGEKGMPLEAAGAGGPSTTQIYNRYPPLQPPSARSYSGKPMPAQASSEPGYGGYEGGRVGRGAGDAGDGGGLGVGGAAGGGVVDVGIPGYGPAELEQQRGVRHRQPLPQQQQVQHHQRQFRHEQTEEYHPQQDYTHHQHQKQTQHLSSGYSSGPDQPRTSGLGCASPGQRPQDVPPWANSLQPNTTGLSQRTHPYPRSSYSTPSGGWPSHMSVESRVGGGGGRGGIGAEDTGGNTPQEYPSYGMSPPGQRGGAVGGEPPPPIPCPQQMAPGSSMGPSGGGGGVSSAAGEGSSGHGRQMPTRLPASGVQGRTAAGAMGVGYSIPSPQGKGWGEERGGLGAGGKMTQSQRHPGFASQQFYQDHQHQQKQQQQHQQQQGYGAGAQPQDRRLTRLQQQHLPQPQEQQQQQQQQQRQQQQQPQQQQQQQQHQKQEQQQHQHHKQEQQQQQPGHRNSSPLRAGASSQSTFQRTNSGGHVGLGTLGPGPQGPGTFLDSTQRAANPGPFPGESGGSRGGSPHRTPPKNLYGAPDPAFSAGAVSRYPYGDRAVVLDGTEGGPGGRGGVCAQGDSGPLRWLPPPHGAWGGVQSQGGYGRQQQQQHGAGQPGPSQTTVKGHLHHGTPQPPVSHYVGGGGGGGGGGQMVPVPAAPMDETQVKRAELVESPTTRLAFKDFYRTFRAKEKTSFHAAKVFAMECFHILPVKVHWRLYLEIADLARRENQFVEARKLYRKVTKLQPFASQGWVEYCKLEEEFGDLSRCSQILRRGLTFCEYSETLLIKAVKQEERAGNLDGARELLSRLKHVGIENVWRTVLEGALLEARSGNTDVARKVLKYLMTHVPWYGPIYYEAFRLEEKAEHFESALAIVQRGLQEIPRYGPLWFGAFRLSEKLDMRDAKKALAEGQSPYEDLYKKGKAGRRAEDTLAKAKDCISKELVWKVHFEAAQIEERLANVCAKEVANRSQAAAAATVLTNKKVGTAKRVPSPSGSRPPLHPSSTSSSAANVGTTAATITESKGGDTSDVSPSPVRATPLPESVGLATEVEDGIRKLSLRQQDEELDGRGEGGTMDRTGDTLNKEFGEKGKSVMSEAQARDSLLAPCRASYAHAVLTCPQNLRWKVWLAGARMELAAGNCSHAQRLLNRAFQEVPEKSKSHVFLECARLEEFTGNMECARQILERARVETKSEWKVFLESVLLEIRANDWQRAAREADAALRVHSGAGRLWAVLVQLKQRDSDEAQQASLKQALKEVPKSGEVWCEGARIHLNPLSMAFDLDIAGRYLGFAVQFTPQYGDSFMECLRLRLLNDLFLPRAQAIADARLGSRSAVSAPTDIADKLALASIPSPSSPTSPNVDLNGEKGLAGMTGDEPPATPTAEHSMSTGVSIAAEGVERRGPADGDADYTLSERKALEGNEREGGSHGNNTENSRSEDDCDSAKSKPVSPSESAPRTPRVISSNPAPTATNASESPSTSATAEEPKRLAQWCLLTSQQWADIDHGRYISAPTPSESSRQSSEVPREEGVSQGEDGDWDRGRGGSTSSSGAEFFELTAQEMAAAGRLTEADLLRAEVEDLLLGCVNADPNYGSMWFHCRHRPSDTAKSILMMAKLMMADELTKLQDVYLHAVTRYVILQREADAFIASSNVTSSTEVGPSQNLTTSSSASRRRRLGITGGLKSRLGRGRGRRREGGVGEWKERLLVAAGRRAPRVTCANMDSDLKGIRAEDFVTGLVSLNRITAQMGRLRSEDRRKILFGSDQIVP